ncbi:MAG: queuosine salvage family protein [Candidatus Eremiobacteraeota bacterium]|nr:queuosine salvage family protein [Candidatus Eremiobacteraeota bacterium]MCW5871850.1 queuosine salvage family protein [Candidatus Eremiobacteraeota bacterium]
MDSLDLGILPACEFVVDHARHVRLNLPVLDSLARKWVDQPFQVPAWDEPIHWRGTPEQTLHYVLLLDALNFCFWVDPGQIRWEVDYQGQGFNGYKALSVALRRALEEGFELTSAEQLACLTHDQLAHILRGRGRIPMLKERLEHANQVGRRLLELWQGDFARAVMACQGSALALTALIARDFPCFYDVSHYQGRDIPLYKRAQITVVDIAGSLNFQGYGEFRDLDQLTAFADYKVPQVLRALGIMEYTQELADRVDRQQLLPPGSEEEVEIRAAMVWAVELIRRAMADLGRPLMAYELDWFFWNLGQTQLPEEKPYHRVRTVFY